MTASLTVHAAPLSNDEWCQKDVDKAERLFQLCATTGGVVEQDVGIIGSGCTMDIVMAFAGAYADVLYCAVKYHHVPSKRELRDLRDLAQRLSTPASQRRLDAAK